MRKIDVATPDPAGGGIRFGGDEAGGLWIVNNDVVLVEIHALAILLRMLHEDVARLLRQSKFAAMQSVVKGLRDFEEIVPAGDHLPASLHLEFVEQRDETGE